MRFVWTGPLVKLDTTSVMQNYSMNLSKTLTLTTTMQLGRDNSWKILNDCDDTSTEETAADINQAMVNGYSYHLYG